MRTLESGEGREGDGNTVGLSAMVFHRANSGEMGLVGGGAESLFSLIDMFLVTKLLSPP